MQIDRGLFQIAMPEQDLDGAQVGSRFEQMRREAMRERMRMDFLLSEAGADSSLLTSHPEHLGGDQSCRVLLWLFRKTISTKHFALQEI